MTYEPIDVDYTTVDTQMIEIAGHFYNINHLLESIGKLINDMKRDDSDFSKLKQYLHSQPVSLTYEQKRFKDQLTDIIETSYSFEEVFQKLIKILEA